MSAKTDAQAMKASSRQLEKKQAQALRPEDPEAARLFDHYFSLSGDAAKALQDTNHRLSQPDAIRVELVTDKRRRFNVAVRIYENGQYVQAWGPNPTNLREAQSGAPAEFDLGRIARHSLRILGGNPQAKPEPELIDRRKES